MAIVQDPHDPSKQGMFSKAGRFTTEKYIIFHRKDEILKGKKKVLKQNNFTQQKMDKVQNDMKKKDDFKNGQKKSQKKDDNIKDNQPFSKLISREKREEVLSVKKNTPVDYYKPKYSQIDKAPHKIWNILKVYNNQSQPRLRHPRPDTWDQCMDREGIPEKLTLKPEHGYITLNNQLDRYQTVRPPSPPRAQTGEYMFRPQAPYKVMNFMKHNGSDPHPERFNKLYLSQTWSNVRKPKFFSIDKSVGREDNKGYFSKEHQPDYNPNFEFGKKIVGKCKLNISKQPPRRPMWKISDTDNENFYDYDKYNKTTQLKSQVFRNIQSSPNFQLALPREIDPNSPLPSFMQKHVNMRSTLTTLHHKMLEENYYSDGRFQSTASEFMKSQSKFRKSRQQGEDDDEEESFEEQQ